MLWRLESIAITLFVGLTPLLVSPFSEELFEFPKIIYLYFITGALLLAVTFKQEIKVHQNKFFFSLILIFLSSLISTVFSIDYYTSLFGYYTRFNGGLVSIFCILVWITFLHLLTLKEKLRNNILITILISGLIVSVYALMQKFGIDKNIWEEDSSKRVFSTLGQPNWLAAYLIPVFYVALYIGFKLKQNIFLKVLPAIIIYLAIWFTYSISGIVALIVSLIIFLHLNFVSSKKYFVKYWPFLLLAVAMTITVSIPIQNRLKEQFANMSGMLRLLQNESPENFEWNYGDTGKIRIILWQGTIKLITSSPKQSLIGSGPETFAYAFPKFRPNTINATSEGTFVHNKPHNWYLELFSNLGLLGFLAYMYFISLNIYLFFKEEKTGLSKFLFSGWISILITNFFGWPTVTLSILFFLLPLIFNSNSIKLNEDILTIPNLPKVELSFLKMFGVSLVAVFLIFISVVFAIADFQFKQSNYSLAAQLNPFEPRYELASIIYEEEWSPNRILNFYNKNKNNPYVVKTLANYINYQLQTNPQANNVIKVKEIIFEDAREISPADNQFE